MRSTLLGIAALVLSACGYSSSGGGTGALYVSARLSGDGSINGSRARIVVREGSAGGPIVNNAEVAIRGGPLNRTAVPFDSGKDEYRLDGFQWVDAFRLEVTRGTDWLDGAIDAPGATQIVNPINGTTFTKSMGQALTVQWRDARGAPAYATTVSLERARLEPVVAAGAFEVVIPATQLSAVDKEKVKVSRVNELSLAGGAAGSLLSASTDHEVEFNIE